MTNTPSSPAPPGAAPSLADRLSGVVVQLRGELDISRHVFRDGPAYVVRDPVTFATHRFEPADYRILGTLRADWTLGQTFDRLVAHGEMTRDEEEDFYAFVLDLHQRSLLTLPVNNADALYQRFEKRRRAEHLSKILGVFFLRVPLVNPDRFLSRTIGLARWLFTLPALIAWALLSLAAIAVAVARFDDLAAPAMSILDGENLLLMWVALIGLKIVHEFGHAYATKAFGGHVPEMGAFFILFTPVAYVDATDSWTFPSARRRAIVTLGGVYFESIVGALAVFVWAVTETSTLNAFAYQVIILATVTTAAFNLNPLLRYDAYYLLSDLLAIPNLRARCQEALAAITKRVAFGLRAAPSGEPLPVRPGLAAFGFAQLAYRAVMLLTITTVLVLKFGMLGIALASVMVGLTLFKSVTTVARYVLASDETAPVRFRASFATFGLAGVALAAVLMVPIPWPVRVNGIVSFERTDTLRAPAGGTLVELPVRAGETVHGGELLAVLEDHDARTELAALLEEIETAGHRVAAASAESPAEAVQAHAESARLQARLDFLRDDEDRRRVRAPETARVLEVFTPHRGLRVEAGDPVFTIGAGAPEAVFHVRAFEFDTVRLAEGDPLGFRSSASPDRALEGVVTHISPVGGRDVPPAVLRAAPGGLVPISPADGRTTEPYFEIRVRLHPRDAELAGAGLVSRLPTAPRTTAAVIGRRVSRFLNRVKEGAGG
jgi:putative peptide zinc metalloprotease protein